MNEQIRDFTINKKELEDALAHRESEIEVSGFVAQSPRRTLTANAGMSQVAEVYSHHCVMLSLCVRVRLRVILCSISFAVKLQSVLVLDF